MSAASNEAGETVPVISEGLADATARALAKMGIDALTLDHIAEEAGMRREELGFASTADALREMVIGSYEHARNRVSPLVALAKDGSDAMTAYVTAFHGYYIARIETFRAVCCTRQIVGSERFGLDDPVHRDRVITTVKRMFDVLEQKLIADKGPSELAGGIHPRRLAFVTHLAATGLLVTKGLSASVRSELLHSDESLLRELTGAFGAATTTVKQLGALHAASGELAKMRSETALLAGIPALFEQALGVGDARLLGVADGRLPADAGSTAQRALSSTQTALTEDDRATEIATPIRHEGAVAAVLVGRQTRAMDEGALARVETFATMVGLALENARLYDNLQSLVDARTAELRQAQAALVQRERMAAAGTLVAGLAHEINTPMASVLASAATLKSALDKLQPKSDPRDARLHAILLEAADTIRVGGGRIAALVDKLERFSHLDASDLARVDLNQSLRDVAAIVTPELPEGASLTLDLDADLPAVTCFVAQLNQVWFNVLLNAAQSANASRITVASRRAADLVEVTVVDDGEGIASGVLPRVFDPGFTTRGVGVGAGMGLAIAYRVVQAHRGTITIDSAGRGARVTVTLPLDPR